MRLDPRLYAARLYNALLEHGLILPVVITGVIVVVWLGVVAIKPGEKPLVITSPDEQAFYLEGSIVVLAPASTPGAPRTEEAHTSVEWWFGRQGVWRWELQVTPAGADPVTQIGVADGKNVYLYESENNTYRKLTLAEYPIGALPASIVLGPADVTGLVQGWQDRGMTVRSGGNSRQMGRDAAVIEYGPTWKAAGSRGESSGGIGRIWVDDETGLVTRNLVDNGIALEYIDAQVTKLDLEPVLDRVLFRFEPPAGAQQISD